MNALALFLNGALTAGYLLAALFFLRFWRRTADRLFFTFACAFALLAVNAAGVSWTGLDREDQSWLYLLRIAAFGAIIVGISLKNRRT